MKGFRFIPIIIMTAALSACGFDMFIRGSSAEEQVSSYVESETKTSSSEGSKESSEGTSSSETKTSSSSDSKESSSSSQTSSTSEEVAPTGKTKIKQTYADYSYNSAYNDLSSNRFGMSICPLSGNPKLLIIPVWFTNSSTYITDDTKKENVRKDIEKAYLGTNEETGWRSVKTFYQEESNGKVNLTGVVTPWYDCGISSTAATDSRTDSLVENAVKWYFKRLDAQDRKSFDSDKNGLMDGVMLIYGAPNSNNGSTNQNLWAYCYWLGGDTGVTANVNSPNPCVYFWASFDFMYGNATAKSRSGYKSGAGDTSHCSVDAHTYIHEMGHVLGLEDYYDYSYKYTPAGTFSMQDANVGQHDPFSIMAFGWVDPIIPTKSQTIKIGTFAKTRDLILLTPQWNNYDSPFDEYMLLELYSPTGLNKLDSDYAYLGNSAYQGVNAVGIRLWHVDARLVKYMNDDFSPSNMTTNTKDGMVVHAMSNTYYSSDSASYVSKLGNGYYDYNILQLIRNNTSTTYRPTDDFTRASSGESMLFRNGSSFDMNTYKKQFKNSGKLNSNKTLGWSFSVSITGSGEGAVASINLVKA